MNIELNYKEKSFEFNISPLMPIAYLRRIAIIDKDLIKKKYLNNFIKEKKIVLFYIF